MGRGKPVWPWEGEIFSGFGLEEEKMCLTFYCPLEGRHRDEMFRRRMRRSMGDQENFRRIYERIDGG